MRTMVIDTSTQVLLLSFVQDEKVIYLTNEVGKNNHSDYLLKSIEAGLKELNLQVKDFDRIVVGIGPGAYTGLRVGLTVAKMFSWTLNIPLYTISSLDIVASGYLKTDGIYSIMMRAKKGYIYGKVLEVKNETIKTLTQETFLPIEEFKELTKIYQDRLLVDEDKIDFNPLILKDQILTKIDDVTFLEPNYLRGVE
jgi:tRNA threonylcarbamoyladenosine biosynthesis protein TsaB